MERPVSFCSRRVFFVETVAFGLSGYGKLRELVSAAGGRGVSPNRKAGKYPEQCPESRGAGMAVSEEAEPVPVGRSLLPGGEKGESRRGFPLNLCNSSLNRTVTFFIIGRGNEKATVLSSVFCV